MMDGHELLELPEEILLKNVLSCLDSKSVLQFGQCSKKCWILCMDEAIWVKLCQIDLHFKKEFLWHGWSFFDAYKVFYPYRWLIGWWHRKLLYYGGLLKINLAGEGIVACECLPPYDASFYTTNIIANGDGVLLPGAQFTVEAAHRFRFRKVFALRPTPFKDLRVECFSDYHGEMAHAPCQNASNENHVCTGQCQLRYYFINKNERGFNYGCYRPHMHEAMKSIEYWSESEHGFSTVNVENVVTSMLLVHHNRLKKFNSLTRACTSYDLSAIDLHPPVPSLCTPVSNLLPPGVFAGTYNAHGWELIGLSYTTEKTQITEAGTPAICGFKLTGDNNVPSGERTWIVNLKKPILISADVANNEPDWDNLYAASNDASPTPLDGSNFDARIPFSLPVFPSAHFQPPAGSWPYPSHYRARFCAQGQVAEENYIAPMFIPAIFVLFDEDTFGVLFLSLRAFSWYFRLKNA